MPEFYLFRLRVERPIQPRMFDKPDLPSAIVIKQAIEEQPSATTRKGIVWALGNVEPVLDNAYSAALGKISRRNIQRYDEESKAFTQEPSEEAPFTTVLLDATIQICAIAVKSGLGSPIQLGNKLGRLLTSSQTAEQRGLSITASQIKDPREFVSFLQRAEFITQFEVTFKRPNPIDVDKDFLEPMERLLAETHGNAGKTSLSGSNLKEEPHEAISNSAAATGDNAKARMKLPGSAKQTTKFLRNNPATIQADDATSVGGRQTIIERMRELYRVIRGTSES